MSEENYGPVSMAPENIKPGGGLIDDADVVIKEACFEMFDFNGTTDPRPAFKMTIMTDDEVEQEVFYTVGGAEWWAPSDDGAYLIPLQSPDQQISDKSNFGRFLVQAYAAGLSEIVPDFNTDVSVLKGMRVHVVRAPVGENRHITAITAFHGRGPAGAAAKTSKAKAPQAAEAEETQEDYTATAEKFIVDAVQAKGGSLPIPNAMADATQAVQDADMPSAGRKAVTSLIFEPKFFKESGRPWTVKKTKEGDVVSV